MGVWRSVVLSTAKRPGFGGLNTKTRRARKKGNHGVTELTELHGEVLFDVGADAGSGGTGKSLMV